MKYRADIDGLRALAVLPVVFFHAGFNVFSGGFVGVDIFFVISGFLITSIIINDLDQDRFSIREFYERRIRRILPALYTVCTFVLVTGYFSFLPEEFEALGRSLGATLIFVSNILFWSETGYFDASVDLKPLLHTWSLAVEEQFYVFFPLLLLGAAKYANRRYLPFLLLVALISFGISIWGAENKPSATFYWAPTRAWELLLGSIIALKAIPLVSNKGIMEAIGAIGLGLIVYAVFAFDYDTVFPGVNAVYPCLGAALLIYAHQGHITVSSKILSLKPLVFIGLCSYSFYLWHWPVFVFAKYFSMNPLTDIERYGLIILTFLLSVITWKFIEAPFRDRSFVEGKWKVFILALLASIPLFSSSVLIVQSNGFSNRFENIDLLERQKKSHVNASCIDIKAKDFSEKKCVLGNVEVEPSFIVWGDSHAGAMMSAFSDFGEEVGRSGILASHSGCPPLLGVVMVRDDKPYKCSKVHDKVLEEIKAGDTVFLVARWTYYVGKSMISHEGPTWINDTKSKNISEDENCRVFKDSLIKTVTAIKQRGGNVVLVDSVPEYPRSVPDMIFLFQDDITVSKHLFEENRAYTRTFLKYVAQEYNVQYVDPSKALCDTNQCYANEGDIVFYFDNDHLSLEGAKRIAPVFRLYLKE
ncbi:MAG: acyltransferase family protein [Alphaproteobacteria bacterium]